VFPWLLELGPSGNVTCPASVVRGLWEVEKPTNVKVEGVVFAARPQMPWGRVSVI
jgi:hypothetical protein